MRILAIICLLAITPVFFAQKGKDGHYTVTALGTVLNTYTQVTANLTAGSTTIPVANTLSLTQGDLIMVIQMQGASVDINITPAAPLGAPLWGWNGNYTMSDRSFQALNGSIAGPWTNYRAEFGAVTNYNDAGKYELVEVLSVAGLNVTVRCGLKNNYTASGHVQVVKIPRYSSLTLNPSMSIVPQTWNGVTGGVVALEVEGTISFGNSSRIDATGYGFRGGVVDNVSGGPALNASDVGYPGHKVASEGAEKGEGIGGYATAEYTALFSRYGNGAIANGGGGGNYKNAGGGGGSNVGTGVYTGTGVLNSTYSAIYALETPSPPANSPGGGRGGYAGAQSDQNEATLGPNNSAWSGDHRRNEGGLGGHPLVYDNSRIFMGGGGGAGEMDANQGGSGGNGGGIVFLQAYGSIVGTGTIVANGANGQNSNPSATGPGIGQKRGIDGAGGAGGGGAIIISNGTALPNTLTLSATGGNGGNNALTFGAFASGVEADGPGGGGGGGMIAFTSGTPIQSVNGGTSGIVTTSGLTNIVANFPPNGATNGATGTPSMPQTYHNLIANNATICSGQTANVSVTVQGTLPAPVTNANITWYSSYTSTVALGTGLSYTTPALTTTTTYYVGFCPGGTFRVPVTVTVGGPTISGTAVVTNATCTTGGSITGLSTTGGVPTVNIFWNGVNTGSMNLTNASADTYTVTVTDAAGCSATSGPYTITTTGGPTISSTNMVVTDASCLGNGGAISGITATGTSLSYNWNSGAYSTLDISNLTPGPYNLTVTDGNSCTATLGPITVGQQTGPVINSTNILATPTSCGLNNGSISGITATGTGLSYNWNSGAYSTLDITGLASGNYNLVVTDNANCSASVGPINIGTSTAPVINSTAVSIAHEHCGHADGAISGLTVSGGQTNYSYSWSPGGASTLSLSNIANGNYVLTVTDALGCTTNAGPFVVNNLGDPVINTTNIFITNETCAGNDGSITGITATGNGTLTYTWNLVNSASLDHTGLSGGTYALSVSDAFGCFSVAGPFNVSQSPGPAVDITNNIITGTSCGLNNGSISGITVSGGQTPYTYSWNSGAYSTLSISNLSSGNYTLVVTDANDCVSTVGPFSVAGSVPLSLDTTGFVIGNDHCSQYMGTISGITVSGGQTPYTYSWNSGVYTTLDLSNLSTGTYQLVVSDFSGCTIATGPYSVSNVPGPTLNTTGLQITAETCNTNDGTITGLTATGNDLTYTWNGVLSQTLNPTDLAAGIYNLVVSDLFGCSVNGGPFMVNGVVPMNINQNSMVVIPTSCIGNTGAINGIQVTGGISPAYSWSNGATTLNMMNLAAGSYTLTVTDNQNCSLQVTVNVPNASGITLSTNNVLVTNDMCGNGTGTISGVTVNGGTLPYTYVWDGDTSMTIDVTGLLTGNHTLVVTDAAGCSATTTHFVGTVPAPSIDQTNAQIVSADCLGNNGSITGIQVTGNGPFTYAWIGSPMTSLDITNVSSGSYSLVVTDVNGCSTTSSVIFVPQETGIIADFTISNLISSPGEIITFQNTSTGGIVQSYNWNIAGEGTIATSSSATYSNAQEGDYVMTLTVVSTLGCVDSVSKTFQIWGELSIPNIVTANGDHVNDEFFIKNLKPNSRLVILNRWGNLVFESDSYTNDWKGYDYTGSKLEDGVYFYQLITADGKMWQGNVQLLID